MTKSNDYFSILTYIEGECNSISLLGTNVTVVANGSDRITYLTEDKMYTHYLYGLSLRFDLLTVP